MTVEQSESAESACNTGVSDTQNDAATGSAPGVTCLIDYLRATFPGGTAHQTVQQIFGGDGAWKALPHGGYGYQTQARRGKITIASGGNGGGIFVDVPGQGCRQIEALPGFAERGGWSELLSSLMQHGCNFSRVDFAFDAYGGLLDFDRIAAATKTGAFTARFRTHDTHKKTRIRDKEEVGNSLLFGSRSSASCVRIYDKTAERLAHNSEGDREPCVRVEIELKNQKAMAAIVAFIAEGPLAIKRDLRARLNFREPTPDANKARWPTCHWWDRFLEGCASALITTEPQENTLRQMAENLIKQYAPVISALWDSPEYGASWFENVLVRIGRERRGPSHMELLAASIAAWEKRQRGGDTLPALC